MSWRVRCHVCSAELVFDDPIGRSSRCEKCASDLRCCNNCRFYDRSAYNECSEPSAERVLEKDRANFCDFFSPSSGAKGAPAAPASDRLSDLEKLFRAQMDAAVYKQTFDNLLLKRLREQFAMPRLSLFYV